MPAAAAMPVAACAVPAGMAVLQGVGGKMDAKRDRTTTQTTDMHSQMTPYDYNPNQAGNQGEQGINQLVQLIAQTLQGYQGMLGQQPQAPGMMDQLRQRSFGA